MACLLAHTTLTYVLCTGLKFMGLLKVKSCDFQVKRKENIAIHFILIQHGKLTFYNFLQ